MKTTRYERKNSISKENQKSTKQWACYPRNPYCAQLEVLTCFLDQQASWIHEWDYHLTYSLPEFAQGGPKKLVADIFVKVPCDPNFPKWSLLASSISNAQTYRGIMIRIWLQNMYIFVNKSSIPSKVWIISNFHIRVFWTNQPFSTIHISEHTAMSVENSILTT